jgi:hypothetical protein
MLKNPVKYERDTLSEKFTAICCQVLPALLLHVSDIYGQRALVDESGVIRTQMGNAQYIRK